MWWSKERNSICLRLIFLIGCLLCYPSATIAQRLSDQARVSVLTCGQGEHLYALFGHTAIRVVDPERGIDMVFNYGTFDFNQSHFYLRFLMGNLEYALTVTSFSSFFEEYSSENRTIFEQTLTFDPELLSQIYDSLEINSLVENRSYRYDFFEDNCTTRVLDLIHTLANDQQYDEFFKHSTGVTFRNELRQYIRRSPWLSLGINMLLGAYSDQKITNYQSYFLPTNLMNGLAKTGWVEDPVLLFQGREEFDTPHELFSPLVIFWFVLVIFVLEVLLMKTTKQTSELFDQFLFSVTGILGLLFLFLMLFSHHTALQSNLNILWANPLNLLFVMFSGFGWRKLARAYLVLYSILIFFCIVTWNNMPQRLPPEVMPLLALIAFRAVQLIFSFVKKADKQVFS